MPAPKNVPFGKITGHTYKVELPGSIIAIIQAAGGAELATGGLPRAMASIVGALPWIAVALSETVTPQEYADFLAELKGNMQMVWSIAAAPNVRAALDDAIARAKRSLQ